MAKQATTETPAKDFPKTRAALLRAGDEKKGNGRSIAAGAEPMTGPDGEGEKGKKGDTTAVVGVEELRERAADAAIESGISGRKLADVRAAIPKERNGFKLDED